MKNIAILLILVFGTIQTLIAQRYLNPVFASSTVSRDIQYGVATNYAQISEPLLLDFYAPTGDTLSERPLLIYIHGGGFVDTNQTKSLVHIVAYCDSLARRGYAVASINYRLDTSISNRAIIQAMHDAKAAVRFFRKNATIYKIDTNTIFIAGESAGAITAMTTSYIDQLSEVQYPPVAPYSPDNSLEGNSGNSGFSSKCKATLSLCGGTQTANNELLFDTTAIQSSNDPPLVMVIGTSDPFIPFTRAAEIAQRADNIGLPNLFYALPGAQHCPWFYPLPNSWEYLDTLIASTVPFLYACVQQNATAIEPKINQAFSIFPNPNNGRFRLLPSEPFAEKLEVKVYDALGNLKMQQKFVSDGGEIDFDCSNFPKGNYFLVVIQNGQMQFGSRILID